MRIVLAAAGVFAVLGLLVSVGCGGDFRASGAGPAEKRVAASFYPLAYAAEEVGGAGVDVTNLTPPGAEPHDLEVSPGDVQRIRSAELVLLLGRDFQPQLERVAGEGTNVLRLLDVPGLEAFPDGDPRLVARLQVLHREYRRGLAECVRNELVTSHGAFAYLAARYGLRQIAITGLSPEAEPSPRDLERVIGLVRATQATTIFSEPLVSPRLAEAVARATGTETAVLNPIEGVTPAEADRGEDYFSLMRANLAALRRALGCR